MRKTIVAVVVLLSLWIGAGVATAHPPQADPSGQKPPGKIQGWTREYVDNFTNPSTLWNYQVYGGEAPDGSDACRDPSHVVVTGGELVIRAFDDPSGAQAMGCTGGNDIVSGGVKLSLSQLYGKYEVRMRVKNGRGVSVVALLWPTSDTWPPEIDFTEDNGASPQTADYATEHWGAWKHPWQIRNTLRVNLSRWHTVGVQWTPGKIVYTMDGRDWAVERNQKVSKVPMQLALQTEAWQCGTNNLGRMREQFDSVRGRPGRGLDRCL